ncbi:MAG TPA: GTPase [Pirellulales bacterium]|nr:GTPase [Pirellulales bacterium]
MTSDSSTVAVVLTPPGRGAVATVLVAGAAASELVGRFFQPANGRSLTDFPPGRIVFGRWGQAPGEELVVCRRAENEIEIHCHGGQAAVQAIVDALASAGCQPERWTDWHRRQAASPIQADALEDLARATTLRTAAVLLDQYHGALDGEINEIVKLLSRGVGWDELASPTVTVEPSLRDGGGTRKLVPPYILLTARERIELLLRRTSLGRHLVKPFQAVLAGRPNVGKSSLINTLVGYQRSIVHDLPGTTRDVVTAGTAFDGWPVELADTAGLRNSDDPLEAAGIGLAEQRLAAADLRILVFDASRPWTDADQGLAERWPEAIVVHSKFDLARASDRPAGVATSAVTGQGIDELARLIASRLAPGPPPAGSAVPFRAWQVEALSQAADACRRGDPEAVIASLAVFRARMEVQP